MEALALVFAAAFVAVIVGINLFYRHKRTELTHIERMAAIERGVEFPIAAAPAVRPIEPARRYLLSGMIWLFSGAGLAFFLGALSTTMPHRTPISMQERKTRIQELRNLGADDRELRNVLYEQNYRDPEIPVGLTTVGFIPMGVGIAYLIFFFSERKRANEN